MTNSMTKRILSIMMTFALIGTMFVSLSTVPVNAASSCIIGHAACGETGTTNQQAGDQTGKEVYMMNYDYQSSASSARHWTVVIRAKDSSVAAKMAQTMIDACNNNHVGYDRVTLAQRQSFYYALKDAGWNAAAITKDVETSCTPLICACICAAGISIKTDHSAKSLYTLMKSHSSFTCYTSSDYTTTYTKLQPGDILLSTGSHQHGAMVVSTDGTNPTNNSTPAATSKFTKGKDYQLLTDMNVRKGAGTSYGNVAYSSLSDSAKKYSTSTSKAVFRAGTVVTAMSVSGDWIKCPSGWICGIQGGTSYITEYIGSTEQQALAANAGAGATISAPATTTAPAATSTPVATTAPAATTTTSGVKVKVGKEYKTAVAVYVRTGPGTNYAQVKRSSLSASAKKCAYYSKKARLKPNTTVTCQKVSGDWMKIPSGWICCKAGNIKNV